MPLLLCHSEEARAGGQQGHGAAAVDNSDIGIHRRLDMDPPETGMLVYKKPSLTGAWFVSRLLNMPNIEY